MITVVVITNLLFMLTTGPYPLMAISMKDHSFKIVAQCLAITTNCTAAKKLRV
jgi:hypothetical protein